jgi:Rrf2 family protein
LRVKISSRGLYALEALVHLAGTYEMGLAKIHEIAEEESIPAKFLEGILVTLKNARFVTSHRGRDGGYRLRRPPSEIVVGDVIRRLDGPLAPFADAAELAHRVRTETRNAGLFELFLDVRNAASAILDETTLQDIVARNRRVMAKRKRAGRSRATK